MLQSNKLLQVLLAALAITVLLLASCSPEAEIDSVAEPAAEDSMVADTEESAEMGDHEHDADTPMDHSHGEAIEIAEGKTHPTVALTVYEDPMMGWNLNVETTDFVFTPENASTADILGEGHAHIYVNGEKIGRLYGNWYHLASLPPGIHEITVSLNGNSHGAYVYAGEPIEAIATVISPDPPPAEEASSEDGDEAYPMAMSDEAETEGAYPMAMSDDGETDEAYPMAMDDDHVHEEGHVHEEHDDAAHTHMHGEAIDIPEGKTHPTVELTVQDDPKMGWNFHVITSNFTFSPENASLEDVLGEGHAHIYVDGEKLGRLYNDWFHIASLEPGTYEIRVSLNGNSHAPYYYAGYPVEQVVTVEVAE